MPESEQPKSGALHRQAILSAISKPTIREGKIPPRECGSCNACCKALSIQEDKDDPIPVKTSAGDWCDHAVPGEGCSIYEQRPDACRVFSCEWLRDTTGVFGPHLHPLKCRCILWNKDDVGLRDGKMVRGFMVSEMEQGASQHKAVRALMFLFARQDDWVVVTHHRNAYRQWGTDGEKLLILEEGEFFRGEATITVGGEDIAFVKGSGGL